MDPSTLKQLNSQRSARRALVLVTDLDEGRSHVIQETSPVEGPLGDAVATAFRTGRSATVQIDGRALFLNAHLPPPRLVMIGAVHISQALASMARLAGFDVEIIDPRTAFATQERFQGVPLHAQWPQDVLAVRPFDPFTAVAALTHDPKIDDFPLQAALEAGCFYVGALGSRKTHASRMERFVASGVSRADIERIHAPIGLDIGASSPAEIAVATLAQVIHALRTRGSSRVEKSDVA